MRRKSEMRAAFLCATAAMVMVAPHGAAVAQEQPAPTDQVKDDSMIVVTAERRAADIQSTPIAVTVLDEEGLEEKGVQEMADLQFATPALTVNNNALTQGVNIRGIGLTSGSPRAAPGVATYRDGVLVPPILNQTAFFDMGTVEVLRGPQGTFAGSYSTGGAIFLNSRNPSLDRVEGYVKAGVGSYSAFLVGGALNMPLSDTFAARVAFEGQSRDSYFDFINGGQGSPQPGGLEEYAGRVSFLWSPASWLTSTLKIEGVDREAGGRDLRPQPGSTFAALAPADPRTLDLDTDQSVHEKVIRFAWQNDFEFLNGMTLRSISGGNRNIADNVDDTDGTAGILPGALGGTLEQAVLERTYSQEINLISPDDGRFSWVIGGYIFRTSIDVDIDIFNSPTGGGAHTLNIDVHTNKGNHGVFAHGRYNLTPSLQAELGVRYSHSFTSDTGAVSVLNVFGPGVDLVLPSDGKHSDDVVTGKAGLNWTVDENNFLFAFVAKGFKPGTVNGSSGILAPAFLATPGLPGGQVDPEIVIDYEAGWRGTLLDGALRTQVGVFYSDYRNFQIDNRDLATGNNGLVNADDATLYGLEAQAQLRSGNFQADFGMAYVHSKVGNALLVDATLVPPPGSPPLRQCDPATGPAGTGGPGCFNYLVLPLSGNSMAFSPEWTVTAGIQYDIELGGDSVLTPRLNYSYIDKQWSNIQQRTAPLSDLIGSRSVLNATLTYRTGDWRVRGYVNNLTNELYVSGRAAQNEFFGPPRTYGVEVTKEF